MGFAGIRGFNYGLDFAGGTLVRVAFREARTDDQVRTAVEAAGFARPMVQTLRGVPQEALIRVESTGKEDEAKVLAPGEKDDSIAGRIIAALATDPDRAALAQGKLDLNSSGRDAIALRLLELDPDGLMAGVAAGDEAAREKALAAYRDAAAAVKEAQKTQHGILLSQEQVAAAAGISESVKQALAAHGFLASYAVLEVGYVGPQVGSDLREKAILASFFAFIGILVYIWFRFELDFGVAAIVATMHDVLLTLGLVALLRIEFDLTIVAAILTIIGYSVNDTIVIFDRIRENLRSHRRADFEDLCNFSVNQTISRTLLTGMTTLFVLVALAILGGDVTRGFAITLILGILIGTYSSIYVASPAIIVWRELAARRRETPARA
jgi:preprotein translocase subunit SecF